MLIKTGYYKRWWVANYEWVYDTDPFAVSLWDYMLCNMALETTEVDGAKLERGDVLVNTSLVQEKRGIPANKTRILLESFCNKTGEIRHKTTVGKSGVIYHILDFENYLCDDSKPLQNADIKENETKTQKKTEQKSKINEYTQHTENQQLELFGDIPIAQANEKQIENKSEDGEGLQEKKEKQENKEKVIQKENKEIKEIKETRTPPHFAGGRTREDEEPPTETSSASPPSFVPPSQQTGDDDSSEIDFAVWRQPRYPSSTAEVIQAAAMPQYGGKVWDETMAQKFLDHYESVNWRLPSGGIITKWQSRLRGWFDKEQEIKRKEEQRNANNPATNIRGTHYVSNWDNFAPDGSCNGFKSIHDLQ